MEDFTKKKVATPTTAEIDAAVLASKVGRGEKSGKHNFKNLHHSRIILAVIVFLLLLAGMFWYGTRERAMTEDEIADMVARELARDSGEGSGGRSEEEERIAAEISTALSVGDDKEYEPSAKEKEIADMIAEQLAR